MAGPRRFLRSSTRRRSWVRTAIAACALTMLATACIDIEMDFVVREDGSGSVTMTMRIDEAVLEFAALGDGGSPEDFCQQAADEAGFDDTLLLGISGVAQSSEAAIENGSCVVTIVSTWSADESEAVLAEMTGIDGDGLSRLENGGWRFELDMSTFEEEAGAEDLSQITAFGFDLPTVTISVTLPGDAVEHNAHSVSQSRYTWEISFDAFDELPPSLYVETAPSSGLGPAAIGAIVAAVLLALAALVTLRRHQEAKAAASGADDAEDTTADANDTHDETSGM